MSKIHSPSRHELLCPVCTVDTTKIKPFSTYVCCGRFFLQPPVRVHVQQDIFEKTVIEVQSSHLYASFGSFYVQISQLFEAQ